MAQGVSVKQLHDLTGMSSTGISNKLRDIPCERNGRAKTFQSDVALAALYATQGMGGTGEHILDLTAERARLAKCQADGHEFKNALALRVVAPVALMERALADLGSQISAVLQSVPQKIARSSPSFSKRELELVDVEIIKCQAICEGLTLDLGSLE